MITIVSYRNKKRKRKHESEAKTKTQAQKPAQVLTAYARCVPG